eukprot:2166026-Prymnesium_polylepis.2
MEVPTHAHAHVSRPAGSAALAAASFCAAILLTVATNLRASSARRPSCELLPAASEHSPRAALALLPACSRLLVFAADPGNGGDSARSVLHASLLEVVADALGALGPIVTYAASELQLRMELWTAI